MLALVHISPLHSVSLSQDQKLAKVIQDEVFIFLSNMPLFTSPPHHCKIVIWHYFQNLVLLMLREHDLGYK